MNPQQQQQGQAQAPQQQRVSAPSFNRKARQEQGFAQAKPYLQDLSERVTASRPIIKEIDKALGLLEKHGSKRFPSPGISGFIKGKASFLSTDPYFRDYNASLNNIVAALSQAGSGRGTEYYTKLLQSGKIDPSMPLQTQKSRLQALRKQLAEPEQELKFASQTQSKLGRTPGDLQTRYLQQNQLAPEQTQERPVGTKGKHRTTGKPVIWDGSQWVFEDEFNAKKGVR